MNPQSVQVPYTQPTAPTCVVWSWGFNKEVLCTCHGSKGRLHKALGPISARQLCYMCMSMGPSKAETAVHGCHYLGQEPIVSLAFIVRKELPFL